MSIFEYSRQKWPKSHTQKLFLINGKIVYYKDVPQLPVPLNTLHTIHLNTKSHDLLFMKLPVRAFVMLYSREYNLQSSLHH